MKNYFWRKTGLIILAVLLLFNVWIYLSGKTFFYKALYYNFANIDDYKLFPERIVSKSPRPQPWPLASTYNKKPLPEKLAKILEEISSVSFLIIKDDSLCHEYYWDGYGKDSYINSFSMAKTMVSALVGVALQEGKIKSIEQTVGEFLPDFSVGEKSKIKIKHLLTMSAGTNWNESYSNPLSVTTEAYYGSDLRKIINNLESASTPGETFNYKSGDTQILGFVLEKATGMSLSKYAAEKLWSPLGAENNAIWSLDKEGGMEKAYCCFNSNARDFARFGNLFLHNGMWNGKRILPEDYATISVKPNMLKNTEGESVDYYGYSWWTIPNYKNQNIFYCRGILGQYIIMIPEKNIVIVRLGKHRGNDIGHHYAEVYEMIDAVNGMF